MLSSATKQILKSFCAGCPRLREDFTSGTTKGRRTCSDDCSAYAVWWFGKSTTAHLSPSDISFLEVANVPNLDDFEFV